MSLLQTTKEQFKEVVALNNNFPFGMLLGGIALTAASAVKLADDNDEEVGDDGEGENFAVVASVLLTFVALVYIYFVYHGLLSERNDAIISFLLFASWTGTAAYVTFEAPFDIAGNGFIAAWLGFISSFGNLIYNVRFADSLKERLTAQGLPLGLLLINSAIVAIAGLSQGCCDEFEALAVVGGSISFLLVVLRIGIGAKFDRLFGLILSLFWTIIGLILTFTEFEEIGNGFLATWACIISSYLLLAGATMRGSPAMERFSARRQEQDGGQQDYYNEKGDGNEKPVEELF